MVEISKKANEVGWEGDQEEREGREALKEREAIGRKVY